jgi:2-amino-4-hydroxy-6-hydroxymethyldihydropteridine diphosphokinase
MSECSPDDDAAILIGLGANLPSRHGSPLDTLGVALRLIEGAGIEVLAKSRWFESAPVPESDQPWFVNGVIRVETDLSPDDLLHLLHRVEARLGRVRSTPNAARCVDLDLLAYGRRLGDRWPILPHPRLAERGFVLLPLCDIVADWHHPVTGRNLASLVAALDPAQMTRPITQEPVDRVARQS